MSSNIYMSRSEFHCELPVLFNGTATRPKNIENYTAPERMRNTVYRCVEYPKGVYINNHGEVRPNHPKSGIYCYGQDDVNNTGVDKEKRLQDSEEYMEEIGNELEDDNGEFDSDESRSDSDTDPESTETNDEYMNEGESSSSEDTEGDEDDDEDGNESYIYEHESSEEDDYDDEFNEPVTVEGAFRSLLMTPANNEDSLENSTIAALAMSKVEASQRLARLRSEKMLLVTQKLISRWFDTLRRRHKSLKMTYDSNVISKTPYFTLVFSTRSREQIVFTLDCDQAALSKVRLLTNRSNSSLASMDEVVEYVERINGDVKM
jgi:hypothetical protein